MGHGGIATVWRLHSQRLVETIVHGDLEIRRSHDIVFGPPARPDYGNRLSKKAVVCGMREHFSEIRLKMIILC